MRSRRKDSFKTFEANTSDAWDDGDDDLIKLASAARQTLSQKNVLPGSIKPPAGSVDYVNDNSPSSDLQASYVTCSGMVQDSSFLAVMGN